MTYHNNLNTITMNELEVIYEEIKPESIQLMPDPDPTPPEDEEIGNNQGSSNEEEEPPGHTNP